MHRLYTAIAGFYWFIWALCKDACGDSVGEYLYLWYRYTKMYGAEARRLFLALPGIRGFVGTDAASCGATAGSG
ncbi:MAG: hypothetical protein SOW20_06550 [Berryella intestinalis]|uniref:hypothetical protein n=1 Tax=Berryella intestinalis TaxID=1531429 RepID=UPI002A4FFCC3|nr:hypothetical protein [Berryella intestinalis]MDD7369008.1 hypothetical protein [Berryella intestinalis]MDY3129665.1 hypothetical protein [Berryella intestinalis]